MPFRRASRELKKDYQAAVLITDKKGELINIPFARPLSHFLINGALPFTRRLREKVVREVYEFVWGH